MKRLKEMNWKSESACDWPTDQQGKAQEMFFHFERRVVSDLSSWGRMWRPVVGGEEVWMGQVWRGQEGGRVSLSQGDTQSFTQTWASQERHIPKIMTRMSRDMWKLLSCLLCPSVSIGALLVCCWVGYLEFDCYQFWENVVRLGIGMSLKRKKSGVGLVRILQATLRRVLGGLRICCIITWWPNLKLMHCKAMRNCASDAS